MKGLSNYEKFLLIRPLPNGWPKDARGIPYLKKNDFSSTNWNNISFTSLSNMSTTRDKFLKIILSFQYDKTLSRIWNNPMKYINKFSEFFAITTPDYSAYRNMELCQIEENVRHNLWLGAWFQFYNLNVIPTITWADSRTYHICFDYIAKGSVVAISTVGILPRDYNAFFSGYNEMMKRIKPELVIIRGKNIRGIYGKVIFVDFDETFEVKRQYEQLKLFQTQKVQSLKRGLYNYGW